MIDNTDPNASPGDNAEVRSNADPHRDDEVLGFTQAEIDAAIAGERRLKAEDRIKSHVLASMTLGLVPVPAFDLAALFGNHLAMIRALCKLYDLDYNATHVRSMLISLLAGTAPVATVLGLSSGAKLILGIGSLAGSGGLSVTAGAVTYAVGRVLTDHFEHGGDLRQPDIGALRARLRRELARGREFALRVKDETLTKRGHSGRWPWSRRAAASADGADQGPVAAERTSAE